MVPRLFRVRTLAKFSLHIATTVVLCGAIALYAVGTDWYWNALQHLPTPMLSVVGIAVDHARPALAADASIAEEQADFYVAWVFAGCIAALAWALVASVRRAWIGRRGHAG